MIHIMCMDSMTELMFFHDSSPDSSSESESEMMENEEDEIMLMIVEWIASTGRKRQRPGSQVGRARFCRNKYVGHERLMLD